MGQLMAKIFEVKELGYSITVFGKTYENGSVRYEPFIKIKIGYFLFGFLIYESEKSLSIRYRYSEIFQKCFFTVSDDNSNCSYAFDTYQLAYSTAKDTFEEHLESIKKQKLVSRKEVHK